MATPKRTNAPTSNTGFGTNRPRSNSTNVTTPRPNTSVSATMRVRRGNNNTGRPTPRRISNTDLTPPTRRNPLRRFTTNRSR